MKIGIVGPGLSGKDTAAEIIARETSLRYKAGTSKWAANLVWHRISTYYSTPEACWQDRRNHREEWAQIIGEYNQDDPVALYRDCLAEQDILTGIRWKHEFDACRAVGLCDLWIYISRPSIPRDGTLEVAQADCDISIYNAGTLSDFEWKVKNLCSVLDAKKKNARLLTT